MKNHLKALIVILIVAFVDFTSLYAAEEKRNGHLIPAKFFGVWVEKGDDGNVLSELTFEAKQIKWKNKNQDKAVVVTLYAVEENGEAILFDERTIIGMHLKTGQFDTGIRKVTMKIKDDTLVVEKRGVPQERKGMAITPLPETRLFRKTMVAK